MDCPESLPAVSEIRNLERPVDLTTMSAGRPASSSQSTGSERNIQKGPMHAPVPRLRRIPLDHLVIYPVQQEHEGQVVLP